MNTAKHARWRRPSLPLVAAVVLAHAVLLRPAPPSAAVPDVRPVVAPVWVRTLASTAPAIPATPTAIAQVPATPVAATVATTPGVGVRTAQPRPVGAAAAGRKAAAVQAAATPPAAQAAPGTGALLADSATLGYRAIGTARGLPFEADAQLRWQRDADRYEAEWVLHLPLRGPRRQHSVGAITAAGLVPERYGEQARGERAAHFDPVGGRIRFSANTPDALLQAGAQDRLSVALQLGGLIAAAPERHPPGSRITLQTAGVRDAEPWHWEVLDDETLPVDGRDLPSVRLLRQPRHEYDTRIELWLARPLGYLPARLRITQASGDVVDQQLHTLPAGR